MPLASPPAMKLFSTWAGVCVLALAALPAFAQHGGSSVGGSHGGGSHGSSGGGHSYGGSSAGHFSAGSTHSSGSAGGSVGYSGARGSSQSYTYLGTGIHATRAGSATGEFTNHGGIRFSDFGLEETPRFSASMLPSRPAATTGRQSYQVALSNNRSEHERWDRKDHGSFDGRGHDFHRFPHFGFFFFGALGAPYCEPFGNVGYDQSFIAANLSENFPGCFGGEWLGEYDGVPDADSDQVAADEYPSSDEASDGATVLRTDDTESKVTLLQLKDGSMYGLTAYWVEGGELHYVTNYGGTNAVPLDRIDFAKTVQLNASHGQAFVLAQKPAPSKATH